MKQSKETETLIAIGQRIANARLAMDMTQAQFARASMIQKSSLSRIEAGKCNLTVRTMLVLTSALQMDIADLFSDK